MKVNILNLNSILFNLLLLFNDTIYSVRSINIIKSDVIFKNQKKFLNLFKPEYKLKHKQSQKSEMITNISRACLPHEMYFSENLKHMEAVLNVKRLLMGGKTAANIMHIARTLKNEKKINLKVWYNAFTSYTYRHPDFQSLKKFSPWEIMPDNFFNSIALSQARQQSRLPLHKRKTIVMNGKSGKINGIENKLWYFREDIMISAQHWYWHIAYPKLPSSKLDRSGELFYYFHQQIMARYNTERLSNELFRTHPISIYVGANIPQGYFAHIKDDVAGLNWTDRKPYTPLSDVFRETNLITANIYIAEIVKCISRIKHAINDGFVSTTNGSRYELNSFEGIDILGDIIYATNYSLNPEFYGLSERGIHNNIHIAIGLASDPQYVRKLPPGMMAENSLAMRDIIFYPVHELINNLFYQHKKRLPPYTPTGGDFPLLWSGVYLNSIQINEIKHDRRNEIVPNILHTYWNFRNVTLDHGLDTYRNKSQGPVNFFVKYLDHEGFKYEIIIDKKDFVTVSKATVRIFLAPRFMESGEQFRIEEQAQYFFALDSFKILLKSGRNTITRLSKDSTVTIPWQTLYDLLQTENVGNSRPYCGCGWPAHLLISKGTKLGMSHDLFAMITNGDEDEVQDTMPPRQEDECLEAHVYCGLINRKYPDTKPLGYPFDRVPYTKGYNRSKSFLIGNDEAGLDDFMNGITNMNSVQVRIFHNNNEISPKNLRQET